MNRELCLSRVNSEIRIHTLSIPMNQSESPVACTDPSPPSQNGGGVDSESCPPTTSSLASPSESNPPAEPPPATETVAEVSPPNAQASADVIEPDSETPTAEVSSPMQLPVNGPAPGSTGPIHGTSVTNTQPQQHSPGSTSSMSSNGSGAHVGYTRQSNPRPRSNKHPTGGVTTPISAPTCSVTQAPTVLSSLPPSAVSAPPYFPPQTMMVDYSHQPPYCGGFVPTGPSDAPPYGTVYYHPGAGYESGGYVSGPPPPPVMGHPPRPPAKSSAGGRYTPSPHSMSGSSSPSSFCQNNNVTTTSVGGGAGSGSANASSNSNTNNSSSSSSNNNQHVVTYHVHSGEVISLQLGDGQVQVIPGKTTTIQPKLAHMGQLCDFKRIRTYQNKAFRLVYFSCTSNVLEMTKFIAHPKDPGDLNIHAR